MAVRPWIQNWDNLKTFFKFPDEIKKLVYTTNAVESLHRQFRKVTKTRSVFPSDKALIKMLYLASRRSIEEMDNASEGLEGSDLLLWSGL